MSALWRASGLPFFQRKCPNFRAMQLRRLPVPSTARKKFVKDLIVALVCGLVVTGIPAVEFADQLMTRNTAMPPSDPSDAPETGVPPHVRRALGPRMADFVGQTPLDQEAADQIESALNNGALEEMLGQVVAVALMNCLERRVGEAQAEIDDYKALSARIEAAAKDMS